MINTRCIRCGAVNFVADEVCRGCGANLGPYSEGQPNADSRDPTAETIASIPPFEGVSDVLGPTLNLFVKNLGVITWTVAAVVVPFEIFKALSINQAQDDWQLAVGLFLLKFLCVVLVAPALIYALMKVLETGKAPGASESYRWGLSKLGKLMLCAALTWLLEVVGTLLFIIPGIIVALSLSLVYPIAVLENLSVGATLQRSRDLTRGHRLKILGAAILLFLIVAAISLAISFVVPENGPVQTLNVLHGVISSILEQTTTVFALVLYLSILRTLERGHSVIK